MRTAIATAVTCLALSGVLSLAQEPQQSATQTPQKVPDPNACQQMLVRHQQVLSDLDKLDADLQQQLQTMRSAQGQQKVDAMARVVETLVEQRTQQRDRMLSLHRQTIAHMAEHVGRGAGPLQCPLLQELNQKPGAGR